MRRRLVMMVLLVGSLACMVLPATHDAASAPPDSTLPPADAPPTFEGYSLPLSGSVSGTGAPVHLRGVYQVLTTDHVQADGAYTDVYRELLVVGDQQYDLVLPKGVSLEPGDYVEVDGTGDGTTIVVATVTVLDHAPEHTTAASGTTSVLVILATWTSPDSVTPASASDVIFNQGNRWWGESSYGALQVTGTVTPWVTITPPSPDCYSGMTNLMSKAKTAAQAKGYNPAAYTRTIVYFPFCGAAGYAAGWAYVPGTQVWLNGFMDLRVSIHEQGHNYGLGHAHSYGCTAGGLQVVLTSPAGCSSDEYGDPYDAMGGSNLVGQFSGPQKQLLGWLGTRKKDLASTDSVDLAPLEGTTGTQVARITVSSSRSYWLEYRTTTGEDADFPAGAVGVQVRMVDSTVSDGGPHLLDMQPSNPSDWQTVVIPPGSSWTSPEGVLVKVGAVTPTSAHVDVKGGQGPPSPPSAPTAVTAKAGDAAATVSWTKPASDNGSMILGYTVTASPGGAQRTVDSGGGTTTTLNFDGLTNGTGYTFTVTARNGAGVSPPSAPSPLVVPNKDVPSVSITAPAPGANLNAASIGLAATATPSPISGAAIASVSFSVDGEPVGTDTTAPFTAAWSTATADDGAHTVEATVVDANGRTASASPISFLFTAPRPSVTITSPTNGVDLVADSVPVVATVQAGSGGASIVSVAGYYDGYYIAGGATQNPSVPSQWTIDWDLRWVGAGTHSLTVTAIDSAGRTGTSSPVTVNVQQPVPSVTITSPASGGTAYGDVTFHIDAQPNPGGGGAVSSVHLTVDTNTIAGYAFAPPWDVTASMRYLADGPHVFRAFAYNSSGYLGSSPPITLIVANPKPSVSILTPASGATVGGTVTLSASVDPDPVTHSPLSTVAFLVGGQSACYGSDPESDGSWSCDWDSTYGDVGTQSLAVSAVDVDGYEGTAARPINVQNPGPTVTITSPAAGATLSAGFTAQLATTVSPLTSAPISYAYFYVDGAYAGYDSDAPWAIDVQSYSFSTAGSHTLQAEIYDQNGVHRRSAPVSIDWVLPPGAPGDLTGTPGSHQMALQWTAPADTGGRPITDYVVQYSADYGTTWTTFADGVSTATSATVTGLVNGSDYYFQVAAKSVAGTGEWSYWFYGTPCAPPGAPTALDASPGDDSAYLNWNPPLNDGGGYITDYVVQFSADSGATWTTFADGETSYPGATVDGLSGIPYTFRVAAVNAGGQGPFSAASASVTPTSTSFVPLAAPARLLDTRPTGITVDGQEQRAGKVAAGGTYTLPVMGRAGIPVDADTVVLNVTVNQPAAGGWVTVYPCDQDRPNASNLNYVAGQTIPNAVIAKLDSMGSICLFTSQSAHLIVDVAGYFRYGSAFTALDAPARLLDSRPTGVTIDHLSEGFGKVAAGGVYQLPVGGRAGVPVTAKSVVLNVTVSGPGAPGWITVFPCGSPQPNASSLNYVAGQTIPNLVLAKLGTGGAVCLFTQAETHLIVDVTGYFAEENKLVPLASPARVVDTRAGGATIDALYAGTGQRAAKSTLDVLVTGRAGVADPSLAVVLNVTVRGPTASGWITVYPCGAPRPTASNLNYVAGQTVPNAVIAKVGASGKVCFYSESPTDLIVDVAGFFH